MTTSPAKELEDHLFGPKVYKIADGASSLRMPNGFEYDIELCRLNTPGKALGWILHLLGKQWITHDHIRGVIPGARRAGVEVDFNI